MFRLKIKTFFPISLFCLINVAFTGIAPQSPCPNLFNYYQNDNYEVYGGMKFKNDLSGNYKLEVNMSIALVTNKVSVE